MSVSSAVSNIADNYRFHLSVRGGLLARLAYLSLYYFFFVVFRWGDRQVRATEWLRRLGLPGVQVDVLTPGGIKLTLDLHTAYDPLYFIHHGRSYEDIPEYAAKAGEVVLDVGANVGVYATLAAQRVGAAGRIIAVEPHPGNVKLLEANIRQNGFKNVVIVQAAVSDRDGEGAIYVHPRGIHHSMVRPSGESIAVPVRTLDAIAREQGLSRVDLLKIDTEGVVPEVLRGARELIKRHHPRIVYEQDAPEESVGIEEFLKDIGYASRLVNGLVYASPV